MDAPAGAVDCRSPKTADNACGIVSLPARTMAGIPPAAGTLYSMSPQGGCQNSTAAKPLRILQYFKILGQGQAGRPQKERAADISPREYAGSNLPSRCVLIFLRSAINPSSKYKGRQRSITDSCRSNRVPIYPIAVYSNPLCPLPLVAALYRLL